MSTRHGGSPAAAMTLVRQQDLGDGRPSKIGRDSQGVDRVGFEAQGYRSILSDIHGEQGGPGDQGPEYGPAHRDVEFEYEPQVINPRDPAREGVRVGGLVGTASDDDVLGSDRHRTVVILWGAFQAELEV